MSLKIGGGSNKKPDRLRASMNQESGKIKKKNTTKFNSQFEKQFSQNRDEELKKMALEIEKQGKKLSENIDIYELKLYKRMVMSFLDEAVKGFGRFSKESFLDRGGRHRVYAIIRTINKELEQLTQDVIKKECDNLAIIGRIDDIRGLILDMIL
ncbi:MAG: YaaR family protein [Clostridiaceae bacterium]|nr:YaaR family protein [Clostridiaceae bacterium]